jgi:hypothetical protein
MYVEYDGKRAGEAHLLIITNTLTWKNRDNSAEKNAAGGWH